MNDSKFSCPKCGNMSLRWGFPHLDTCKCGSCQDPDAVEYACDTDGCGFWFRYPEGKEKTRWFVWANKDGETNVHQFMGVVDRSDTAPNGDICPLCNSDLKIGWRCNGHNGTTVRHILAVRCENGANYYQCTNRTCGYWYIDPSYKERYRGELGFLLKDSVNGETTHHSYQQEVEMAELPAWFDPANPVEVATAKV